MPNNKKKKPGRERGKSWTLLVHGARPALEQPAPVNPPISRASTYLHRTVADMRDTERRRAAGERVKAYGRRGTDTGFLLEDLLVELEGGHGARLTSCGLAANTLVFQTYLRPGDRVLVGDSVYGPVRKFVTKYLPAFGIAYELVATNADEIAAKLTRETKLIYLECPGSTLFELTDLPRVVSIARANGALVAVDNTWGSALLYNPIRLGADISILSATKYLAGHSDVLLGAVVANEHAWPALNEMAELVGASCASEDAYLVLRGLRTLAVRLNEHARQAGALIEWFRKQPFTAKVYYPTLADHPDHAIWKRDFSGSCGLFSVEFTGVTPTRVEAFVDALELFGIGSSWGGFESLARVEDVASLRTVSSRPAGPLVRFHAGFEAVDDLIRDLESATRVFGEGAR